jgi:hypothetical protein
MGEGIRHMRHDLLRNDFTRRLAQADLAAYECLDIHSEPRYQSILIPFPRGGSRRQGAGCFRLLLKDLEATRACRRAPCLTSDNQDSHSEVVTSSTIDNGAALSEGSGEADYEDGLADPRCGGDRRLAAWRRCWRGCCHRALTRQQGDVRAGVFCTRGRDPILSAEFVRRGLSTDGVT